MQENLIKWKVSNLREKIGKPNDAKGSNHTADAWGTNQGDMFYMRQT